MPDRPPLLHFGGPDRPARILRDLLKSRIEAVPPGHEIAWATYYFRDIDLAEALIAASGRGVRVTLQLEGRPRCRQANAAVAALIGAHGLGGSFRLHWGWGRKPAYMHAKIYAFGGPTPSVLVGSFNPSGNVPEDPDIIAQIGDQDRGHNLLAEYFDADLVRHLSAHIARIGGHGQRLRPSQNAPLGSGDSVFWLFPRMFPAVIERDLARLSPGATIRGAISHLKRGGIAKSLARLARTGIDIRLLVHDTQRRVPDYVFTRLAGAGVSIRRYVHPEGLPLHSKLLLVEERGLRSAYFGSFNFNQRSQRKNHEILVRSRDAGLVDGLVRRLAEIESEGYAR